MRTSKKPVFLNTTTLALCLLSFLFVWALGLALKLIHCKLIHVISFLCRMPKRALDVYVGVPMLLLEFMSQDAATIVGEYLTVSDRTIRYRHTLLQVHFSRVIYQLARVDLHCCALYLRQRYDCDCGIDISFNPIFILEMIEDMTLAPGMFHDCTTTEHKLYKVRFSAPGPRLIHGRAFRARFDVVDTLRPH